MAQSFSNPLVEQKEFIAGNAAIALEDKTVFTVSGEDRLTWLNDLFSQKLDELSPGSSVEALWLDAQGRIVRDFHISDDGETTWLITFSSGIEELITQLSRMVFRAKAKIEYSPNQYRVVATWGKPKFAALVTWVDPWPNTTQGGWRYGTASNEPWVYAESVVTSESEPSVWELYGKAGTMALDALRVAAMRPAGPNEIDDKSLPHEYDWLATAVHMSKGCYRGQEAVAKVHNLGHPPRRLVFLHLDGSAHALPELGDEIFIPTDLETPIGKVTSVGQHFESGPIALGLVKRNVPVDSELMIIAKATNEQISASQEVIVPPDAGAVVDVRGLRGKKD